MDDERRLERIERMLYGLVRDQLPRKEFDRRFTRLEDSVGEALERLSHVEVKAEGLADLGERMNDVEDVAATVHAHERRRGIVVPSLVTAAGIVVNAALAAVTWMAGNSHHA